MKTYDNSKSYRILTENFIFIIKDGWPKGKTLDTSEVGKKVCKTHQYKVKYGIVKDKI